MFSIDGLTWAYPCAITREAVVVETSISGYLLNGVYFSDVQGTYLSYSVRIAVPINDVAAYNAIYEALTKPVGDHTFILPYGSETVTFVGRVTAQPIHDEYIRMPDGGAYWRGITFSCRSNNAVKEMSLNEVIARGMTPLPPISSPEVGDAYVYTATGWQRLTDADDTAY